MRNYIMRRDNLTCPHCRVGRLDLKRANVLHFHGSTLICAPNTPAWQCDVCQYREFDANVLRRIGMLLQRGVPPFNQYRPLRSNHSLARRIT
jgi:rubredoxin